MRRGLRRVGARRGSGEYPLGVTADARSLLVVLLLGLGLRLGGIGWGLPRYDAALASGTAVRSSFHPDEDKILRQLAQMRPEVWDFHPGDFGWGTLHTYLVGGVLWGGRLMGAVEHPLRAFREATPGELPRVFRIGRAVSAAFGVATLVPVFLLARRAAGPVAGLLAATVLAVSPLHVVHSQFLNADVALGFWIALATLCLDRGVPWLSGLTAGLALATKPSAVFLLPAFVWVHVQRRPARAWAAYPALAAGFLLGQPYALLAPVDWWRALAHLATRDGATGASMAEVTGQHAVSLALYGLGPVALILAVAGLRRTGLVVSAAAVCLLVSLPLSRYPMARYTLPVLPLLAVASGVRLSQFPRRFRLALAALALVPALAVSLAQVGLMRRPHTAQRAADWIATHVDEGRSIVQLWPEYPILDARRYRLLAFDDAFGREARPYQPLEADVVIQDDLPFEPFRSELEEDLRRNYTPVALFEEVPRLGPLTFPEPAAPHDWKYTHPRLRLWRRR